MTALTRQVHATSDRRAVVEQARGALVGSRGCTAGQAMAIMTTLSRESAGTEAAADVVAGAAADTPGEPDSGDGGP